MWKAFPQVLVALALAAASGAGASAFAQAGELPSRADDAWAAPGNLFAKGRYEEAARAYFAFEKDHPKDPRAGEARFRGGESLFRAGKLQESLDVLAALREDVRAAFREANALYLLGRAEEAASRFKELLARKKLPLRLEAGARYFLARSLLALSRPEEALECVARAPKGLSGPAEVYLKLALGDVEAAAFLAPEADPAAAAKRLDAALSAYRAALGKTEKARLVPEILFRIGEILRSGGRHKEALEHYRRAADEYASSPVAPYARLGLAWAAFAAGDPETAAREAARSRELARERGLANEARYAEGSALLSLKRYDEAAKALEPLLERPAAPVPPERFLRRLAWSALAAGRRGLAHRAAKSLLALALPPDRAREARFMAGEVLLAGGRPKEALSHFSAAAEGEDALAALAGYRRGAALFSLGDPKAAAGAFEGFARDNPGHRLAGGATALAARAFLAAGDPDRACDLFKEARAALGGRPEEPEVLWGSALAEYMRGGFLAMAGFARRIVEGHPSSPRAADAAYWLGWWHLERRKYGEAARRYKDAAELAREAGRAGLAAGAMLEAASALEKAGDGDGALEVALGLVTGPLAPQAPVEAALWVADALRKRGKAEEARKVLDRALERVGEARERVRLLYARGELARASGEVDRALPFFERVLEQKPETELRHAALLGKARCLVAKGRRTEAEVILQNVADRTAGWARAAAYVELGRLHHKNALGERGEARTAAAERAARDFMWVVILYVPEGPGEGAELCAEALLGAARAYAFLGRYKAARDRLEQLLQEPLYRTGPDGRDTPQVKEARKLLEQVGLKAHGSPAVPAPEGGGPQGGEDGSPP